MHTSFIEGKQQCLPLLGTHDNSNAFNLSRDGQLMANWDCYPLILNGH